MDSYEFIYNNNRFIYSYKKNDGSGPGCIREIVTNDEYNLKRFAGHKNKWFIDIGANCGVASMILAKQNPESTVLSFEPDESLCEVVNTNLRQNNITNCKIFNLAVTKPNVSELKLHFHPLYTGGNTTIADESQIHTFFNRQLETKIVNCISLDEIIKSHSIPEVELLKIDCEGAEYDILYNSEFVRLKYIKNLVGEFHNLKYNNTKNDNYTSLINYLKKFIETPMKLTLLTI